MIYRRNLAAVVAGLAVLISGLSAPALAQDASNLLRENQVIAQNISGLVIKYRPIMRSKLVAEEVSAHLSELGTAVAAFDTGVDGTVKIDLTKSISLTEAESLANTYAADMAVEWAEPNYLAFPSEVVAPAVPNDTYYAQQWNLWGEYGVGIGASSASMTNAWGYNQGQGITVAVIDTGYINHPDLSGRIVAGYDFVSSSLNDYVRFPNGTIRNGNNDGDVIAGSGYGGTGRDSTPLDPGDWHYYTTDGTNALLSTSSWHGTHVSGIVSATSNNAAGISGVAPQANIQPIRALGWNYGLSTDIADAITWASGGQVKGAPANATPAHVINLSLGGPGACPTVYQQAIDGALSRGSIVVVAAGNENTSASESAPGNCNGVITVAATDRNGTLAPYSNYGSLVEVVAPGGSTSGGIFSTVSSTSTGPGAPGYAGGEPVPAYAYYMGTSMAAPHVAGAAALLFSSYEVADRRTTATRDAIEDRLKTKVRPLATNACLIATCGSGIVNALAVEPDGQALNPLFDAPVQTADGFTVNMTNYDPTFTFTYQTSVGVWESGTATGAVLPLRIKGLNPGLSSTLSVATEKSGSPDGKATLTASSRLGGALTPAFGPRTVTATGFIFEIINYSASFTFTASATAGTVVINAETVTVSGLTAGQSSTVTVTSAKTGYSTGTRAVTETADSPVQTQATPVIDAVSGRVSSGSVTAGQSVTISVAAVDDVKVETVTVTVKDASGVNVAEQQATTSDQVTWSAIIAVPLELQNQIVKVFATAKDAGNNTSAAPEIISFEVLAAPDAQTPIALTNTEVFNLKRRTGDSVIVTFAATDDIGVLQASVGFYAPNQEEPTTSVAQLQSGSVRDGVWVASLTLPKGGLGGVYTIRATVNDASGKYSSAVILGMINVTPVPALLAPIPQDLGFTVPIQNLTAGFSYVASIASSNSTSAPVAAISDGAVVVTNLSAGSSATVTLEVTRSGYDAASVTVTGTANAAPVMIVDPGTGGGGFGGGGGSSPAPVPVTVVSGATTSFTQDPSTPTQFTVAVSTGNNVSVEIPVGAAPTATSIKLQTSSPQAGVVTLKMELLTSTGEQIKTFISPLALTLGTVAKDTKIATSEDGTLWTLIPLLSEPILSSSQQEGYYLNASGAAVILTKHLSFFAAKKEQPAVTVAPIASTLPTGSKVALSVAGGSGTGLLSFVTASQSCTVSSDGQITTTSAGECKVTITKAGDDTYLPSAPISIATTAYGSAVSTPVKAPLIVVTGASLSKTVTLSLSSVYANRNVTLQVKLKASKTWRTLKVIKIGSSGKAKTVQKVVGGSQLRILSDSRAIATVTVK